MFKIRHRTFFPTAVTVGFQSKWVPRGLSFHAKGAGTSLEARVYPKVGYPLANMAGKSTISRFLQL